jgi:hypothetical protein
MYSSEEAVEMEDEALLMVGSWGSRSSGPEALEWPTSMVVVGEQFF